MLSPEMLWFVMRVSKGFEVNYYHLLHRFLAPEFFLCICTTREDNVQLHFFF